MDCFQVYVPDWPNMSPKNNVPNAKEAMDLAEKWMDIPQVISISAVWSWTRLVIFFSEFFTFQESLVRFFRSQVLFI